MTRRKRGVKLATKQKSVSLPTTYWEALEDIAELQTEAFRFVSVKTTFTVSDLVELGAEMFIKDIIEDLGPLPQTPEERKDFVRRLAQWNQERAYAELHGRAPKKDSKETH